MTRRERILPWTGFVLGALGWAVSQQWGSDRVNDGCLTAWSWQTVLIGLLGLTAVLIGAWLSLDAGRRSAAPTARFVAALSLAADVVFALAILFHTLSPLIIPRCFS